jgi:hypothetical protein
MLGSLAEAVAVAAGRYHRLIYLVGSNANDRSALLHAFARDTSAALINVSIVVSESLLPLPRVDRVRDVGVLLDRLIRESGSHVVCLNHIEVLFIPELRVDVLGRLQQLARNQTLIVNWPGTWSSGTLTYAETGHPEFFQARTDAVSVFTTTAPGPSPV